MAEDETEEAVAEDETEEAVADDEAEDAVVEVDWVVVVVCVVFAY